jgi:hypothetical protein
MKKLLQFCSCIIFLFSAINIYAGSIPKTEISNVIISDFYIDYSNNKVTGEILNSSKYKITECELQVTIYEVTKRSELENIYKAIGNKYEMDLSFSEFCVKMRREDRIKYVLPFVAECYEEKTELELTAIVEKFYKDNVKLLLKRKFTFDKQIEATYSEHFDIEFPTSLYSRKYIEIVEITGLEGRK